MEIPILVAHENSTFQHFEIHRYCALYSVNERSPYLPTRTDKSRQEPTRAVKSRQEAFLCIFQLKYYLLDPIHALFI